MTLAAVRTLDAVAAASLAHGNRHPNAPMPPSRGNIQLPGKCLDKFSGCQHVSALREQSGEQHLVEFGIDVRATVHNYNELVIAIARMQQRREHYNAGGDPE
jgi:hypothetical protein